jgi:hypothetical protein
MSFFKELWAFMRKNSKAWVMPSILILVLLAGLIIFAEGSAIAPFIYTLF